MRVLTEMHARHWLNSQPADKSGIFIVEKDAILTPSAKSYLAEHKVTIISDLDKLPSAEPEKETAEPVQPQAAAPRADRYESAYGGFFADKPEHMTQLYGAKLVFKDHKVIRLRGMIDSFEALILETQISFLDMRLQRVSDDLEQTLDFVKTLMRCEVLGEPVPDMVLLSMNEEEIRRKSHDPKRYFGVGHFAPSISHGKPVILLNTLRTQIRMVEIHAYEAFKDEYGQPARTDIIRGFNRLSSVYYIMMVKMLAGEYK
ncbi:MAG: cobalamin adenosyltransferase [Clostridiales bacterium]|jgi:ethanolamine utilization cobalamin adenosyltransferase|nr:cobalamin adenosyltransferase [Clostridiales bacterium]